MKNKEIENGLEGIGLLENQMGNIQSKIDNAVASIIHKDFPEIKAYDIYCPFTHECGKSPFGWCVYDQSENSAINNCLYCGESHERNVV